MISQTDLNEALDRIARTEDGRLLYLYFQRVIMELPADAYPTDGALRQQAARRSFAGELMGLMANGIDESAGSSTVNRPVVFVRRGPVAGPRNASVRERIASSDPELASLYPAGNSPGNTG